MSDLTYCYLHMSRPEIEGLFSLQAGREFIDGTLSDEELDIPPHMIPPNPDDADTLPSEVHPSYPYGNPLSLNHPASLPRVPYDFSSRALYEDLDTAYGLSTALRWKDLALDTLLPADEKREQAARAAQARDMANGTQPSNNTTGQPPPNGADPPEEEGEDADDDEDEDEDEFNGSQDGQSSEELEEDDEDDEDEFGY